MRCPGSPFRPALLFVTAAWLAACGAAPVVPRPADTTRSAAGAAGEAATSIDADDLLATVQILAAPEWRGRLAGSPGGLSARAWIVDRFATIGLEPVNDRFVMPFPLAARGRAGRPAVRGAPSDQSVESGDPGAASVEAANILGYCRGENPIGVLVISAHYDHVGERNGGIHPGADDNASGVAVMLALANQCVRQPFVNDALFVAFDAEEQGLQGSRAFVAHPPIPLDRILLNVNLDMVSRGDRGELYAAGTYHWPNTRAPLDEMAATAPIALLFGHDQPRAEGGSQQDWTFQSDHASFHGAGVPFVYFGVEDHPDYHQPTDTPDRIDPVFFHHAAETILDAVRALDRAAPFR